MKNQVTKEKLTNGVTIVRLNKEHVATIVAGKGIRWLTTDARTMKATLAAM